ncbi:unnamed protein product [Blepharisma stoltei]|uniref:Uncharacterized protein n=1 Tax=Blepharisma stoltei TaxID=1481888 RepID=A0AAU9IVG4_9CILI|nr:unnamed protein product [Blepharisma stoltei]
MQMTEQITPGIPKFIVFPEEYSLLFEGDREYLRTARRIIVLGIRQTVVSKNAIVWKKPAKNSGGSFFK